MKTTNNPVIKWQKYNQLLLCHNSLKDGLALRAAHPLTSGSYKLREALEAINRSIEELEILSGQSKRNQKLQGVLTCKDHVEWLKDLPVMLSKLMGWKVLPAFYELDHDGVSKLKLSRHMITIECRIKSLILDCEDVLPVIRSSIQHEYSRWRRNESLLMPLVLLARAIVMEGLILVEDSKLLNKQ